ncbi:GDSL-type esterase/lipase family protein [Streptomyces violascens]|uniref:GDSL-type esterase/lipase family protein n=1 Tax=Streptomyces violascens TaxID=67381 RepID=UPI0037897BD6
MATPTTYAQPRVVTAHRAATFNTHATDLWRSSVYDLTQQVEVLALQEVRDTLPPDAEPADGVSVNRLTTLGNYTVERFRWTACPSSTTCTIYRLRIHRQNRSLAIVVRQARDLVTAVNVIPPRGGQLVPPDAKPALGIQLADGTWFYNIHARNRTGTAQRNDAPDLVDAVARASGNHWAAMGDFNRTPDSLPVATAGGQSVIRSGQYTFPRQGPASELDYMVAKGIPAPDPYTGFRLTFTQTSDHFPVGFWTSATVNPVDRQYRCPPDPGEILRQSRAVCVPPKPAVIVSMGDSYASGEAGRWAGNANTGAQGTAWGTDRAAVDCDNESDCAHDPDQVYGPTSYSLTGNRCDRSDTAPILQADYPRVDSWQHFNLACSGATTDNITGPYTEKGERAQNDQLADIAANYRVKAITVSIGGNDLGFKEIVESCAKRFFLAVVAYCKNVWPGMDTKLDDVGRKVTRTLTAVQDTMSRAGYRKGDYRLVVQSYPAPLPPSSRYRYPESGYSRYSQGGCPFYDTDTDWARQTLVDGMRDRLRKASTSVGAVFLDLSDAFAGHELCATSANRATSANSLDAPLDVLAAEWVRWIPYVLFKDLLWSSQGDQQEAIHPNAFGQQALGACLTDLGGKLESKLVRPATDYTCRYDPVQGIVVTKT